MTLKRVISIVVILFIGLGLAYTLIKTAPKPQKKQVEAFKPLVETAQISSGSYRPTWQTGGSVNAKPSVKLMAQVTGQIIKVNDQAVPGAQLNKGDLLAQVDPENYELVVAQKQAALVQAQSALEVERGQVKNAENNYKLSNLSLNKTAKSLALREPQLASAKAALNIAQAELKKAKLDLARTQLRMPFDGHLININLTQGSFVNANTQVFELVDSSEFWVQVKVPQAFASLLDQDAPVVIKPSALSESVSRTGYVKNILPAVDANDRQVRVLVAIKEPLKVAPFAVRFNDYVNVTLSAKALENVYQLSIDALNDDQTIWVVDKESKLQLRQVEIIYKGRHHIWVKLDMKDGDAVLKSRLQIAAPGMPVRVQPSGEQEAAL